MPSELPQVCLQVSSGYFYSFILCHTTHEEISISVCPLQQRQKHTVTPLACVDGKKKIFYSKFQSCWRTRVFQTN